MEKQSLAAAYRRLKSPNGRTRRRALKLIKQAKKQKRGII